jgi:hypothetical protein
MSARKTPANQGGGGAIGEPPSNMRITDRGERDRWQHANVVTDLTEAANGIQNAMRILRKLAERDTVDCVCGGALLALDDAGDHLDDVLTALEDGRLTGPGDAG